MRTAIYVYSSGTKAVFQMSSDAVVRRYETPTSDSEVVNDNGICVLTTGIYKVLSDAPPKIALASGSEAEYEVVAMANDKDPWPEPPPKFHTMFGDVSTSILREFLPAGLGGFSAIANDESPR